MLTKEKVAIFEDQVYLTRQIDALPAKNVYLEEDRESLKNIELRSCTNHNHMVQLGAAEHEYFTKYLMIACYQNLSPTRRKLKTLLARKEFFLGLKSQQNTSRITLREVI